MTPEETTLDSWLGGRLTLAQPKRGHRVGSDAALLAAAAFGAPRRIVDVGAGVGAVGLALGLRFSDAEISLVEIDPELAALARDNATRNALAARVKVFACDVTDAKARRAAGLADGEADLVVTNPPFYEEAASRVSPDPNRARAHAFSGGLALWLKASLALLRPGGRFAMIHRPDALPAIYAALAARIGDVAVRPVHPKAGEDAIRLLLTGVKGSRAPSRLRSGLVLHEAEGQATPEALAIHEGRPTL